MKKLTQFSVHYPVTIAMLILAILLLGGISLSKLGVELFPDLNNPRIFVEIQAGERPPEELEKQFVENIESLAIRQKKVTQVSSIIRVGAAQTTVEYSWDADMDEAFLDLQKALTSFAQNEDIDELNITQHDPDAAPIMTLSLLHPELTDMDDLRRVSENYLRNELVRLEGIAEVELLGVEEKEVVIKTDSYLMKAFNLTPAIITNKIESYNRNVSGGSIVEMGKKYVIKGVSEFSELEDIGNVILTYEQHTDVAGNPTGENIPVFLRDVATIEFDNKEPENIVHVNQQRCIALAIYKETKYNTVKAVNTLLDEYDNLQKALPGYQLDIIQNQGEFIRVAVNEVRNTLLIGIVLAIFVLFLFLRRVGATTIIAAAIPISIIATFNLMYFNDLTLNIMTLGGLALGAGMLVDNAIVVMENIFRLLESGKSLKEAAIEGPAQVGGAITASTITTIVVFLPIVYLHGSAGELFKDQAWTVAFALISSLVVAILIIPMLASKWLSKNTAHTQTQSIQFPRYEKFLSNILARPWFYILIAVALVAVAFVALPFVGSEFIPKTESDEISIEMTLPEGTELYRTEATVGNIENAIKSLLGDEILTIYSTVGPITSLAGEEDTFQDENSATLLLNLNPQRSLKTAQIITRLADMLQSIPDAEFQFIQDQSALTSTLGTDKAPLVIQVRGEEIDVLQDLTEQIKAAVQQVPDLFNIESSFDQGRDEVNVVLDRVQAGILGVTITDVSTELNNRLTGRSSGDWEHEGEMQDITLKLPDVSLSELQAIEISANNQNVRLDDIADIAITTAPKEINRFNQSRIGIVSAHIQSERAFDQIVKSVEAKLSEITLPADYRLDISGEEAMRKEAFAGLRFALLLSVILVYMVLAAQFESLVHPFTILLTIPLALVGSIFIFLILGKSLNIMALIGVIMLVGIAVNDSIVLVDRINQIKLTGVAVKDAILQAGTQRIRPIVMTSLTTILALLPLTIGFGEGAELRAPMALAVIGGLITSTFLTLVFIPCVYYQMNRLHKAE